MKASHPLAGRTDSSPASSEDGEPAQDERELLARALSLGAHDLYSRTTQAYWLRQANAALAAGFHRGVRRVSLPDLNTVEFRNRISVHNAFGKFAARVIENTPPGGEPEWRDSNERYVLDIIFREAGEVLAQQPSWEQLRRVSLLDGAPCQVCDDPYAEYVTNPIAPGAPNKPRLCATHKAEWLAECTEVKP